MLVRRSSAARRAAHESIRLRRATIRRQLPVGSVGMPLEYTPGRVIERVTKEYPVIVTSSQIDRCPAIPTAPPNMQWRPIVTLPDTPTHAAIIVCAPTRTLWAI